MVSLEEKQAALIKRWQKLFPAKAATTISPGKKATPPADIDLSDQKIPESNFERLARSIWEASGRDLKSIVPPGKKNQSWYLLNLKLPITEWIGNVAVGQDKYFEGWYNVVPPTGCTISYFGPGAFDRAHAMAEKITGYYS